MPGSATERSGSRACTSRRTRPATSVAPAGAAAQAAPAPARGISKLTDAQQQDRLALVPLRVYFTHGLAKVELALARGRRTHEKRQAIVKREHEREMRREVGRRR